MSEPKDFVRMPGLYRLWDLQFVFDDRQDFRVHFVETTDAGAHLFAVYRRSLVEA